MAAITATHKSCFLSAFHTGILSLLYHIHSASGFHLYCVEKMLIVGIVSQVLFLYFFGFYSDPYSVCVSVCLRVCACERENTVRHCNLGIHNRENKKEKKKRAKSLLDFSARLSP